MQIKEEWEEAPPHILRLDISSLLNENSDTAIDEVCIVLYGNVL